MPIERPNWNGEDNSLPVPVETNSAIVTPEEGAAMVAEVEAAGDGVESEQLEALAPIAATLYSELSEAEVDAICDEFDALPAETQKWVESIVVANRHASLKRLAKLLKGKATLEHAAAMREVGWY